MKYKIYTDGACTGNPGPGGWGAVIFDKDNNQKNISGNEKNTTNNRTVRSPPMATAASRPAMRTSGWSRSSEAVMSMVTTEATRARSALV